MFAILRAFLEATALPPIKDDLTRTGVVPEIQMHAAFLALLEPLEPSGRVNETRVLFRTTACTEKPSLIDGF